MTEELEGPGAALRAAREGLGVSSREVAEALNLPVHVIEAMESNDYERLPQAVFARGYLRSYARLLELDPDAIVARLPIGQDETVTSEVVAAPMPGRWLQRNPGRALGLGAVVAVAVLALLTWWLAADDPEAERVRTQPAAGIEATPQQEVDQAAAVPEGEVSPLPEPGPDPRTSPESARKAPVAEAPQPAAVEPAQQISEESPAQPTPRSAATRASTEPEARGDVDTPTREVSPSSPARPVADRSVDDAATEPTVGVATAAIAPADTGAGGTRRITEFGDDALTFTFSDDCWVEVKSASGANLYSDLNRAGSTLTLVGAGPFRILLGYAPGVGLEFNDERVALAPHTRNNVATLVLGQ